MGELTASQPRYRLAFSVGGLFSNESVVAAALFLERRDWASVRAAIDADNLLRARTVASAKRQSRELVQRLAELADGEIELLTDATANERGHLMWAAACRRYDLVGEFAEEVVRERFLLLKPTLVPDDFDSFVRFKAIWHPELEALTESTLRKLRANVLLMLRQAGLLSPSGEILPCLLSPRVSEALRKRSPSDLRFFPTGGAAR
ncbi:MAG: DUF1819 family protein [Candidatus Nanopelagicales bacterium]|nr:DUF1819 family protein [Candidatus Nanopelagicales bacterium]MDZ4249464.1 DUF1819 family protein [Candidatus Nanopelagicales bacterium]